MKILKFSILSIAQASVLMTSCDFKKQNYRNTTEEEVSLPAEDTYEAQRKGYDKGYDDGYRGGYGWIQHGVSYNDRNSYQTDEASRAYKNGYSNGYDEGDSEGECKQKAERELAILSDWHNWEDEDVDGLYVYIEGVEDDDEAEYVDRERYEGEYIREGWKYLAKIDHIWGEYEVTLGYEISSDLFKIQGSDIYIHFMWGLPDVDSGDEGVLDWDVSFSSFYIKPDKL